MSSSSTLPLYYKPRGVGTAAVPPVPGRRSTMTIFVVVVVFIISELALVTYNYSYSSTVSIKYSRKSENVFKHRIPHTILSSGPSEKPSIIDNSESPSPDNRVNMKYSQKAPIMIHHESASQDNSVDTKPHPIDKVHEGNQPQRSSNNQKSKLEIMNSREGVTLGTKQGILTKTQKRQAKVKEVCYNNTLQDTLEYKGTYMYMYYMYMYIYVHVHMYMYIYVHVHMYMYIHVHVIIILMSIV